MADTKEKRRYKSDTGLRYSNNTHTLTLRKNEKFYVITKGNRVYVTDEAQEVMMKVKPESVQKLLDRSVKLKPKAPQAQPEQKSVKRVKVSLKKSKAAAVVKANADKLVKDMRMRLQPLLAKRTDVPKLVAVNSPSWIGWHTSLELAGAKFVTLVWRISIDEYHDPYTVLSLVYPSGTPKDVTRRVVKQPIFVDMTALLRTSTARWNKLYNLNFKKPAIQFASLANVGPFSGELVSLVS